MKTSCLFVLPALMLACGGGANPTDGGTDSSVDGVMVCEGAADGTSCGVGAICIDEECVPGRCGDGVFEPRAGEQCDDGANGDDTDGCRDDCTYSCEENIDCLDEDRCNGSEKCDDATHACISTGPPDCDDLDPCTTDGCDMDTGCVHPLNDVDMDGFAPAAACETAGLMGGDCDDEDATAYPGAAELCDMIDNDCDGVVDNNTTTVTCLRDQDRDGFGDPLMAVDACACPAGYIPPRSDGKTDCADRQANVFPGQTEYFATGYCPTGFCLIGQPVSYDYNCDGEETYPALVSSMACMPLTIIDPPICVGTGWVGGPPGCGESSPYQICTFVAPSSCTAATVSRMQVCR